MKRGAEGLDDTSAPVGRVGGSYAERDRGAREIALEPREASPTMGPPTASAEPVIMDVMMVDQPAHGVPCRTVPSVVSARIRCVSLSCLEAWWIPGVGRCLAIAALEDGADSCLVLANRLDGSVHSEGVSCSQRGSLSDTHPPLGVGGTGINTDVMRPGSDQRMIRPGRTMRSRCRTSPRSAENTLLRCPARSPGSSSPEVLRTRVSCGLPFFHANLTACGPPR